MAPVRLACIDMAGTTVRDDGLVIKAFAGALDAVGVAGDELDSAMAYAHATMGLPKTVVFNDLLGNPGRANQALAVFDHLVLQSVHDGWVTELEGARGALSSLRQAGVAIALTTGFTQEVQNAIIKQLGWADLADLVVAPGPELRGRPFPDMVLFAALKARVDDVRQIAVVGDTANDLVSGHRAGASVLAGVLTGSHSRQELEQAPHTHVLESISELPPLVLGRAA